MQHRWRGGAVLCLAALGVLCAWACITPSEGDTRGERAGLAPGDPAAQVEAAQSGQARAVWFEDFTEEAGIAFVEDNGRSSERWYAEILGGGVIFFDAEGDGDPDLYFLNGHPLRRPLQSPAHGNAFYRNAGDGHFTEATAAAGLTDGRYALGACGADYDNDGDQDLYVTHFDEANALYRNDGTGAFTDVAAAAGVEGGPLTDASCAFADVDGDGWLDLYVAYYVDHGYTNQIVCEGTRKDGTGKVARYCTPRAYKPLTDRLYRNRGDGTFQDISVESGIGAHPGNSLGVAFADFDGDRDPDLFVACDRTPNLYFRNDGRGRFTEIGGLTGADLGENGRAQAGMGVNTGDFDGDGTIDVAVTYFHHEPNGLYRSLGNHAFEDASQQAGTARGSIQYVGWGTEFFDADLDGDLDWYVANGHVLDNAAEFGAPGIGYPQQNLFYLNTGGGKFQNLKLQAGPALSIAKVSRGLAAADIDADGDLDLCVANLHDRPDVLRNRSPRRGQHWLMVRTEGTRGNRDGIGARLELTLPDGRVLVREIHSGQSYLSQSDMTAHFGLGLAQSAARLRVLWPSGGVSDLAGVPADQVLRVREPD